MPKYYLLDENKNLVEGYDKEGFLGLLEQVIEQGSLENIPEDSAVASKLRSILNGTTHHIEFVTQAQYNQLVADEELVANTWYFITDDTSVEETLDDHEARIEALEELIPTTRITIQSIDTNPTFASWENATDVHDWSAYVGEHITPLDLRNSSEGYHSTACSVENQIILLPVNCISSLAEAKVEYVSGDDGYLHYALQNVDLTSNIINFKAFADKKISPPNYADTYGTLKQTIFKIVVRDIYNNVLEKEFEVNFRSLQ